MTKDTVLDVVDRLMEMEFLEELDICQDPWTGYKLTPDDLLEFEFLPILFINRESLNVTKENAEQFRKVLKKLRFDDEDIDKDLLQYLDEVENGI